jgi:hypothetical protein
LDPQHHPYIELFFKFFFNNYVPLGAFTFVFFQQLRTPSPWPPKTSPPPRSFPASNIFHRIQPHEYFRRFIEQNVRPDGRLLSKFRRAFLIVGAISTANGSAILVLAQHDKKKNFFFESPPSPSPPTIITHLWCLHI